MDFDSNFVELTQLFPKDLVPKRSPAKVPGTTRTLAYGPEFPVHFYRIILQTSRLSGNSRASACSTLPRHIGSCFGKRRAKTTV
jgi:hypothetical protein